MDKSTSSDKEVFQRKMQMNPSQQKILKRQCACNSLQWNHIIHYLNTFLTLLVYSFSYSNISLMKMDGKKVKGLQATK